MQGTLGDFLEGTVLSSDKAGHLELQLDGGKDLTLAVTRCQDVSLVQESRLILSLSLFHIDFPLYLFVF